MIAKNPNEKGSRNIKPVLIGVLAIVIVGVGLSFIILSLNKGKKDNTVSLTNEVASTTDAENPTPVTPVVGNDFNSTEYFAQMGDDPTDIRSIIVDMTPVDESTIDTRFPADDDEEANNIVIDYVWEYTDGQIDNFFNFLSISSDFDSYEYFKSYYTSASPSPSDYDEVIEDEDLLFMQDGMLHKNEVILYYPYFVYNAMKNNDDFSFAGMYESLKEIKRCEDIPTAKYNNSNHSEIIGNIPFYEDLFALMKTYNGEDASSHEFKFGAPAGADGVFSKNLPDGETAAYVVPIKDLTKGNTIGCVFNKDNKIIRVVFL